MPQTASLKNPSVPVFDAKALLHWYDVNARALPWRVGPGARAAGVVPDPYRVWLSEIMLQQTTVAAVRDYFARFTGTWPTIGDLARAPLDKVLAAWAGLGYYARARNLYRTAQMVAFERDGVFPKTYEGLLELPGIGPYTAAAIAAICYDKPVPVLDGNVERVMARLLALDVPVRQAKPELRAAVAATLPEDRSGDFAQAMMDLGATLCAPKSAACLLCPIETTCRAAKTGDPARFPVAPEKPRRPTRFGHAFVMMRADGAVLLRARPEKGVLAKMTEVPGSAWTDDRTEPDFPMPGNWKRAGEVVHVFTHFRLELIVWRLDGAVVPEGSDGWWSPPGQWSGEALPSLFKKVLASARP